MAYGGYLLKVKGQGNQTDYIIPMHDILEKTYDSTYSVMDYDSTRSASGKLIRNAQKHRVPHCSIQVKSLNNVQLADLMNNIQARYVIQKEKKLELSMFLPEINDYVTVFCYIPDIKFVIRVIENNTTIHYESFTLEFIGY